MNIGILGGGQLALMMAQAGRSLGQSFMFLCPNSNPCAAAFGEHLCAPYDDESALKQLAAWADVVTYEFENVSLSALELLQEQVPVYPSASVLAVARDRLVEKQHFGTLGIPTARFAPVETLADLTSAVQEIRLPAFLKTRTQGYDGKGQALLRGENDLGGAWEQLGKSPCIVESKVAFKRELSVIAARGQKGEMVFYPISENRHREGILRLSINRLGDPLQIQANSIIKSLMENLKHVGVMALELFQVNDQLFANEFAPRVHNSGHWTIEAAQTSQFENHLRAICGLPLGEINSPEPAAMVNLIGRLPEEGKIRDIPGATPHFYGKEERPNRKVGHITLTGKNCTVEEFDQRLRAILRIAGETELAGCSAPLVFDNKPGQVLS
ncbi:N5-carboxyaminoimidazole ribonucleotide synthase [Nitrospina gracilis 3/211]|uniref:N5-carboxyaminoimidazole ribonucleotide synthase n=1 Tax=Nitrospina gracilis (strain 3/211) TaxID=1266370 RepID=M1ZA09_NITG3|nr:MULTISPECIES: 5-(carboxyamino)imidazole ribonucleotide synthase [Nitrospina]MCF8723015.1 5-(carboxyamino)imidazole ribonucleotide synthase [Nitrospina sp. Nb-3]CCQ90042.1 N5-carboxyaminoimidazole ribonucleotide synthase [Nitrospina gracilis 3/211]